MKKGIVLVLIFIQLFVSCKKESLHNYCNDLNDGIAANDMDRVKAAVNQAISQLQNNEHTASNLSSLTALLSSQCGITAETVCYNCIFTNPGQSEIRIMFTTVGVTHTKVIDISNTASNKMVFVNMHD